LSIKDVPSHQREQFCKIISSAIRNSGFQIYTSFSNPGVFKTDASVQFIQEVSREWEKVSRDKGYESKIDFSDNPEIKFMLKHTPPRFLPNPEKNWGPKSAAKIKQTLAHREKGTNGTSPEPNQNEKSEVSSNKKIKKK
jgi:hypothetical protein